MKTLFRLLLLIALVAGAIWAWRSWLHRDDLRVTLIVDDRGTVAPGAQVLFDGRPIGEVTEVRALEDLHAVAIRIDAADRSVVKRDSKVRIEGERVIVDDSMTFASRLESGDVLRVRNASVRSWIARQTERFEPLVEDFNAFLRESGFDSSEIERELDGWKAKLPELARGGKERLAQAAADAETAVEKAETELRRRGRNVDADRLRAEFDELRRKLESEAQTVKP